MVARAAGKAVITPFVGRADERARFNEAVERAQAGAPTLLLFEGETGSGKTSLLNELARSPLLSTHKTRLIRIDLTEPADSDPVHRAADKITHAELFARVGGRRRFGTFVRKVLPDWMGAVPILGDFLEAITVTVQALRRKRRTDARESPSADLDALHQYARRRMLLLLIDNVHRLEEPALDRLLRLVNRAQPGTRLLVLAAARTPPPGSEPQPFRILINHALPDRAIHQHMSTLGFGEVHDWLNQKYRDRPLPPSVVNFLLTETGSQPGPILEMLDRMLERGALQTSDAGWSYDLERMDVELDATEDAKAHLAVLRPEVANIVRAASVFGDEFDALSLAQLVEIDELELEDRLAVAVRVGLLNVAGEWTQASGEISTLYRFTSSAVRASLHRSLSADQRRAFEARMSAL